MIATALRALGREPGAMLFDLDGTLLDSAPDLAWALDRALEDSGLEAVGEATTRRWIGNGVDALIDRAMAQRAGNARVVASAVKARFLEYYTRHSSDRSRLYPGVCEAISRLHAASVALGCVTNKPQALAGSLLATFDLSRFFDVVLGGDSLETRKPDPAPLLHAADALACDAGSTVFVGDSTIDVEAARACRMRVVCVRYGYNFGEDIANARPDAMVDCLTQIADWVDSR